jgi:hypothetical protein
MDEEVLVTEISSGLRVARIKGVGPCDSGLRNKLTATGYNSNYFPLALIPYIPTYIDHMPHVHDDPVLPFASFTTSRLAPTFP